VGVKVGSGVKVAVTVFVAGTTVGWDVEVALVCSTGANVDVVGLAQADRNMITVNNRVVILFMVPLFIGKQKGAGRPRPYKAYVFARALLLFARSNLPVNEEIASSPYGLLAIHDCDLSFQRSIFHPMRSQIFPKFLHHRCFVIRPVADVHLRYGVAFEDDEVGADAV
jgi:hypothetical protein